MNENELVGEQEQYKNMTDRELMQQALLALRSCSGAPHWPALQPIVTALRERLARLDFEMEPCAGRNCGSTNPNLHSAECFEDYEKSTGMNQWQGLTDDVVFELADTNLYQGGKNFGVLAFAKAIEQALKEKNT
jgi:hypothetical protein